jgi:hypothetical protein
MPDAAIQYVQPALDLAPAAPTWASIIRDLGVTWERWPDSWHPGRDFSAGWTGIIHLPDRSYIHIQVRLWRRLLNIKWQVDAWRMDFHGEDAHGRRDIRRGTRVYLEDPTPAEALAAAAKLGLVGLGGGDEH